MDFFSNPFASAMSNSTMVPGLGYIPNNRLQSDSRGSWIGAGPGMTSTPASSSSSGAYAMPTNPYVGGQAEDITNRTNTFLNDALARINSNSVGVGNLGGARQGVAQGTAIGNAADMLSGNLAQLYGGNYNQEQNRNLQRYGFDQGFYTQQRGQDLQQAGLGANLWNLGTQGAWAPINNANGVYSAYSGFGPASSTSSQGGGTSGLLSGALAGIGLAGRMGAWSPWGL